MSIPPAHSEVSVLLKEARAHMRMACEIIPPREWVGRNLINEVQQKVEAQLEFSPALLEQAEAALLPSPTTNRKISKGRSRVRRPLDQKSRKVVIAWCEAHKDHPYPTDGEKQKMLDQTNLTSKQLSDLLGNWRRRIWKGIKPPSKSKSKRKRKDSASASESEEEESLEATNAMENMKLDNLDDDNDSDEMVLLSEDSSSE